jgi:uncharacterized protein
MPGELQQSLIAHPGNNLMSNDSLKHSLTEAMKDAMRAKEKLRLVTLRMILAAIKQKEVDERIDVSDQQILDILNKMVKQRLDAAKQYVDADRQELADKENAEIIIIEEFLPEKLSDDEVETLIKQAMTDSGATSMQDMGKVMGIVKSKVAGRADMGLVGEKVKALLG